MRILFLLLGTAANALIAFLTHVLLTRNMATADYGQVVAITAAVTMLTPLAGMSIGWFWLELAGREQEGAARWGPASRKAAVLMTAFCCALLAAWLLLSWRGALAAGAVLLVVGCACAMLLGQTLSESRAVALQLGERFGALALWQSAPQALRSVAVMLLILGAGAVSDSAILLGYAAAALLTAALSLGAVRALTRAGSPQREQPGVAACLRAASPFAMVTLFYLVYSTGILALINPLIGAQASAYYNVGFLIFNVLAMLPSVIYSKFLAGKLFSWWSHDQEKFVAAFHLGVASHFALGLLLGAITWFTAPWLVPLLFGEKYQAAVPVLQILALGVPIRFIQHGYGSVLFSQEHIRRKVAYMGVAALLSVCLLLWLAPRYGVAGAAACSVLSELVLLILYMYGAARYVDPIDVRATLSLRTLGNAWRRFAPATGAPV